MRWYYYTVLLILLSNSTQAQKITGLVQDKLTKQPVVGAEVQIVGTDNIEFTNSSGTFRFLNISENKFEISVNADGYTEAKVPMDLDRLDEFQKSSISLEFSLELVDESAEGESGDSGLAVLSLDDLQGADQSLEVSSLLTASRDPFNSIAAFNFRSVAYALRGYQRNQQLVHLNGVSFNDIEDGGVYWGTWGGLNDVFRARSDEQGLFPTDFSFGGLSGDTDIDLRASSQWKQIRATYNRTNISYANRAMLTYSTGLMENGWAFSFSGSRRWGERGYVAGTYYDANSYFLAVEKRFNDQHSLNLNIFGSQYRRGRPGVSYKALYEILDDNFYNPNWGYQNGKVRNSREYRAHQPISMLRHDFKLSNKTKITTTIAYQTGYNASTGLNWLLAPDPRPDYYRNLPGFQENGEVSQFVADYFSANPDALQLQWDDMININKTRGNLDLNIGGFGIDLPEGNLSAYTVEESYFNQNKIALQSRVNTEIGDRSTFAAGIQLTYDQNHNYRKLDDLLGGDYSIDINRFALRDFPGNDEAIQNDVDNPNQIVQVGDIVGFDYYIHNQKGDIWAAYEYSLAKFDISLAGTVNYTQFWREGNRKTGLFPENSAGIGEKQSFLTGGFKPGITYKINGRNYVYANGILQSIAPFSRFAYTSPRTRHDIVNNLESQKITGGEIGYIIRHPLINARVTGFYTLINDQTTNRSFFNDDLQNFVNYVLNGIDTKHVGVELGANYKLTSTVTIKAGVSNGLYTYNSRPVVTITQDNSSEVLIKDRTIYIQNYNVPNMPRLASSFGIEYRSPKFWSVSLNANYLDGRFSDFNPERRTTNAVDGISELENPVLWNEILQQEQLSPAFTVDFFGRKSFKINDYFLYLFVSVNNLLDNKEIEKIGFEEYRFDYQNKDVGRFPNRYYHTFGRTFSISLSFKY